MGWVGGRCCQPNSPNGVGGEPFSSLRENRTESERNVWERASGGWTGSQVLSRRKRALTFPSILAPCMVVFVVLLVTLRLAARRLRSRSLAGLPRSACAFCRLRLRDRVEIGLKSRWMGSPPGLSFFLVFRGNFMENFRKREASHFITLKYYHLPSWCSLEQSGTY